MLLLSSNNNTSLAPTSVNVLSNCYEVTPLPVALLVLLLGNTTAVLCQYYVSTTAVLRQYYGRLQSITPHLEESSFSPLTIHRLCNHSSVQLLLSNTMS